MAKGTRSGLFFEIMRLIDEKESDKPRWLIIENVKNLLAIDRGVAFFTVLNEMAKRGYGIEWGLYNSKNYGVPQNRERVYIVGYSGTTGGRKILPTPREGEGFIKQIGNMIETEKFGGNPQTGRVYSVEGCAPTLSTPGGGGHIPKIIISGHLPRRGQRGVIYDSEGIVGALTASDYKGAKLISVQAVFTPKRMERNMHGRRVKRDGEPSFTLTTQDRHGVILKDSEGGVRIRTLTPKECWRLQGFSDEQFEKAAKVNSNTQLYKQAGNAVTVPVVKEIGQAIMDFVNEVEK